MSDIIAKTKNRLFYISPKEIKYCIYPSKFCDYTHAGQSKNSFHVGSNKDRPHAGNDRGVFSENLNGLIKINDSAWDRKHGILFTKLYEYESLLNHYNGKEKWRNSIFAKRCAKFIKLKNKMRGFSDPNLFLQEREKQIDLLFNSIIKDGIMANNIPREKNVFVDNISTALTEKGILYFNNRGHHRLSIAKIINLAKIPIKITVAKSNEVLEKFYIKNE